jgi:hypothetical protein
MIIRCLVARMLAGARGRLTKWEKTRRLDREINRLENAIFRGDQQIAEIQGEHAADNSDDSWLPIDRKQIRRRAWLVILLRKRGRPRDLERIPAIEAGEAL